MLNFSVDTRKVHSMTNYCLLYRYFSYPCWLECESNIYTLALTLALQISGMVLVFRSPRLVASGVGLSLIEY